MSDELVERALAKLNGWKCDHDWLGCQGVGCEPHTCPFAEEISGNMALCTCCDECMHQCAMDI